MKLQLTLFTIFCFIFVSSQQSLTTTQLTDEKIRRFEEATMCAAGNHSLVQPVRLGCGHSVCKECLSRDLECPKCHHPYFPSDLSLDHVSATLLEIIQDYKTAELPPCGECGEPSVGFCTNCNNYLCQHHIDSHSLFSKMKTHKISDRFNPFHVPNCNKHDHQELILWCDRCKKLICQVCAQVEHKGHDLQLVTYKAQQIRQELERKFDTATSYQHYLKQSSIQMREHRVTSQKSEDKAVEIVEQSVAELMSLLKQREQALVNMIRNSGAKCRADIDSALLKHSSALEAINFSTLVFSDLLPHTPDQFLLQFSSNLFSLFSFVESVGRSRFREFVPHPDVQVAMNTHTLMDTIGTLGQAVSGHLIAAPEVPTFNLSMVFPTEPSISLGPDLVCVVSHSHPKTVFIFDGNDGTFVRQWQTGEWEIDRIAKSCDPFVVVCNHQKKMFIVFDMNGNVQISFPAEKCYGPFSVDFSRLELHTLFSYKVEVYSLVNGSHLRSYTCSHHSACRDPFEIFAESRIFVTKDRRQAFFNKEDSTPVAYMDTRPNKLTRCEFDPVFKLFAIMSEDKKSTISFHSHQDNDKHDYQMTHISEFSPKGLSETGCFRIRGGKIFWAAKVEDVWKVLVYWVGKPSKTSCKCGEAP